MPGDLAQKLIAARERRGWSHYRAANEMAIGHAQLMALEGQRAGRETDPGACQLRTVTRILLAYPELELSDFLPRVALRVIRLASSETLFVQGENELILVRGGGGGRGVSRIPASGPVPDTP